MRLLLAETTNLKTEIPVKPNDLPKVESVNTPILEVSAAILSVGLALAALLKASTAKHAVLKEAEASLIKNMKEEIEEKDEEIESLKRKVYRLENRLRIADIELSSPLGGYTNGPVTANNSGSY